MNCPRCKTSALVERVRDDIEIDHCDSCRGVWLDRGELEKIIANIKQARASEREQDDADNNVRRGRNGSENRRDDEDDDDDEHSDPGDGSRSSRRRGGWLDRIGGLFD